MGSERGKRVAICVVWPSCPFRKEREWRVKEERQSSVFGKGGDFTINYQGKTNWGRERT